MLKDEKAGRMFSMLHRGHCVAEIARRLKMSERTIRTYRDEGVLPSQRARQPRAYRTRQDPLEPFWPEIEELLREDPQLRPFALLDWLKQKYNPPAGVHLTSYADVMAGGDGGPIVVAGDPDASVLIQQLEGGHRSQSAADIAMLRAWISEGALNN